MTPPPGFAVPDQTRPIDVDKLCAEMPADAFVRGMYMQGVLTLLERAGKKLDGHGPYIAFKEYHVINHVRLIADAAPALYPKEPLRRAMNLLGRDAYGTLVDSMIGRVIFGVLGRDIVRITKLVGKAYEVSGRGVTATLLEIGSNHSHVRIDGAYGLVDCYHLGAFEGLCDACGRSCVIYTKQTDRGGELFTVWSDASQ